MGWLPKKKVVVPIDFSEASQYPLTVAFEMVENPADVHVFFSLIPLDSFSAGAEWGAVDDETRRHAVESHFEQFLNEHGATGATRVLREGDPGTQIVQYANECGADLIVMPSHGHHGLARLLLGSVTERVVRHAECPILVLRTPKETAAH